jgi:hypothetical protein
MGRYNSQGTAALEIAEGILADLGICIRRLEMIEDRLAIVSGSLPTSTATILAPSVEDARNAIAIVQRAQSEFKRSFLHTPLPSPVRLIQVVQQNKSSQCSRSYRLWRPRARECQESGGSDAHAWA